MKHTITPEMAANLLGTTPHTIRIQMQKGTLPIGMVFEGEKRNRYIITKELFEQTTGIKIEGGM